MMRRWGEIAALGLLGGKDLNVFGFETRSLAILKRLFQTFGCIHVLRYSSRGDRLWGWIAEKVEPRFGAFPRLGALLPDWVKLPAPHAQLLPSFMNVRARDIRTLQN